MSQHQAGFAGVPVKRLKQTALTWNLSKGYGNQPVGKKLCKTYSQWRKSGGTGRDCPSQSFDWGHSSVDSSQSSDFGGSVPGLASRDLIKGISHVIILKQSVLSSSSNYIYD